MSTTPKIVKRYANRKLYDTDRSCYVTLEDISIMIKAGEEVRVIDNKSGEDLTTVTFAQIIFETEKKKSFMPLSLLRGLIQERSEALGEIAREGVDKVQARAQDIKETATKLKTDLETRVEASQKAFDDLQSGLEERVKTSVGGAIAKYSQVSREVEDLRKKLAELAQRMRQG